LLDAIIVTDKVLVEDTTVNHRARTETMQNSEGNDEFVQLPINGVLDLHSFQPRDVKDVTSDYLELCQARGILEVRVVHGKGVGQLRQTVHALLKRMPIVRSFSIAGTAYGGEGATIVHLHPPTGA
jgi:dsDNA-specific endonuclease/ATPase MutS2